MLVRAVRKGELSNGRPGHLEQVDGRLDDRQLSLGIARCSERPTERVRRDQRTRHRHLPRNVAERADVHADGRDSRRFDRSLKVPN